MKTLTFYIANFGDATGTVQYHRSGAVTVRMPYIKGGVLLWTEIIYPPTLALPFRAAYNAGDHAVARALVLETVKLKG